MDSITLYGINHYDRSGKIRWLLEELGVAYEDHWLDVEKNERDEGAYLNVNPLGRVPAIVIDDRPMIESGAICSYVADRFSQKGLAPALTAKERLDYLQWMYFAVSVDSFASRIGIIEDIPAGEVAEKKMGDFLAEVRDLVGFLEKSLNKKEYLVEKFSAADVCVSYHLYVASLWPEVKAVVDAHPQVVSYLARLKQRPAAQKSKVFSYEV